MRIRYFSSYSDLRNRIGAGDIEVTWKVNQVGNGMLYEVDGMRASAKGEQTAYVINDQMYAYEEPHGAFQANETIYFVELSDYQSVINAAQAELTPQIDS